MPRYDPAGGMMFTTKDVRDEVFNAVLSAVASRDYGHSPILAGETFGEAIVLKLRDGSAAYITVNSIREPCRFTFSHTRNWCGHPFCRPADAAAADA